MASQSEGIRKLLDAEKKAAEKVAEARRKKARRIKQAKEEAMQEIEKFKKEREAQFLEYERKHMGSREEEQVRIDKETRAKLDGMNRKVSEAKDGVISDLIRMVVFNVEPQLHKNYRLGPS